MDYARRRERVLMRLAEQDLGALVVTNRLHVRYLTGFTGEGFLLLAEPTVLCTDRRYEVEAREQAPDCEVNCAENSHLSSLLTAALAADLPRLAFEPESLTFSQHQTLSEGLGERTLVPVPNLVSALRQHKEPEEVALIAQAAAIVDGVLQDFLPSLTPGRGEKRLAWDLTQAILEAGAEEVGFTPIVASGPHSALPHATLTDRVLQEGDILVVDVGAKVEGYCSDITRTLALGEPPPEFAERYRAVREAQQAAIAAAQVGKPLAELDQAAREVLTAAGMGEQFSHSLGHGVGLEVHEAPSLSRTSPAVLEVGHVVTIEPGVYFEGWGGIRLEDLFLVEESGLRQLTTAPKLPL